MTFTLDNFLLVQHLME